jgi:phosphate transport system permease protein
MINVASMDQFLSARRKWKNRLMLSLVGLAALTAILPLMIVFFHILREGLPALNVAFFTSLPAPTGQEGGGMGNAILGSMILVVLASLVAVPIGILGGVYLSEYADGHVANMFRWTTDLLTSLPSIVVGLFVYATIVAPFKSFSAYAGAAALALLMVPIVVKTTEEVLKLMPQHIREAGLALGLPRWRVILFVVLRGRMPAVMTGVILALARIAGETAPLLITAFGNRNWPQSLSQPTPSLPVQIYNYAISPYADWQRQAWAGALTLVFLVFLLNLVARLWLSRDGSGRSA